MSLCNIVTSVNKIKQLFRKYGASNVNEAFLFDVSILLLLLFGVSRYILTIVSHISLFHWLINKHPE